MKTLKSLLFLLLLVTSQFSFGAENDCCYPDTSKVQLVAMSAQQQLDYLQCESHAVIAKVPSLEKIVTIKLGNLVYMLEQVQMESEQLGNSLPAVNANQIDSTLKSRLPVQ
ncbi:MAG: hypothetical protein K1X61_07855 [Chitinophagales bacterium]|nr:hypothetical protein [Chitinophagales bacterium]